MRPRTIDSASTLEMGLIDEIVEPAILAERAMSLAGELANGPTLAYAAILQALAFSTSQTLDESLAMEAHLMRRTGTSRDHQHALDAFLTKEKPLFLGN